MPRQQNSRVIVENFNPLAETPSRISAKNLFLTYPRCPVSQQDVLTNLRSIVFPLVVESYVIGRERHQDGTHHIHCYLSLSGKVNKRSRTSFDFTLGEQLYHGNYQGVRYRRECMDYCKKGIYYPFRLDT